MRLQKSAIVLAIYCFVLAGAVFALAQVDLGPNAGRSDFKHPGLLNSQQQLTAFKEAAKRPAENAAFSAAYLVLKNDFRASDRYQAHPTALVEVAAGSRPRGEETFKNDAIAAYLNALQWVATGDRKHRDKAIEIMDGWAGTYRDMVVIDNGRVPSVRSNVRALESAWTIPIWTNAAEIMRHFDNAAAGWPADSVEAFRRFIERLYAQMPGIEDFPSNRGVSHALATMAAGVFLDNRDRYAQGLARLERWLTVVIRPSGEIRELRGRDCYHPQFSLTGFVQGAEIASNQLDDRLWRVDAEEGKPRLARGLEYIATALTEGSKARDCRGKRLLAGYAATAAKEYRRLGIGLPRFERLVESSPPDHQSFQFIGWSSAIHGRGFDQR